MNYDQLLNLGVELGHTLGMAAALSVGAMLVSALVRTAVTARQERNAQAAVLMDDET